MSELQKVRATHLLFEWCVKNKHKSHRHWVYNNNINSKSIISHKQKKKKKLMTSSHDLKIDKVVDEMKMFMNSCNFMFVIVKNSHPLHRNSLKIHLLVCRMHKGRKDMIFIIINRKIYAHTYNPMHMCERNYPSES